MHIPLPISARMNKKLNLFLSELNIPPKPIATAENEQLYDKLRENVLKMFSLQKHLKKKEIVLMLTHVISYNFIIGKKTIRRIS